MTGRKNQEHEILDDLAHRKAEILRLIAERIGTADGCAPQDDATLVGPSARELLAGKIRTMRSRRDKGLN
jgi:hypothetical protein